MITKEELLEKLLETRICDKHRAVLKLALKGLEYEKIEGQEFISIEDHAKIASGVRTYWESKHDDLVYEHRITVNNLRHEVDSLTRSRNFWRKKYNEIADELDNKIIALGEKLKNTICLKYHVQLLTLANQKIDPLRQERDALKEELKAKDASLAEAFKIIDNARAKHRDLEIQTNHLRNGRKKAENQIGVLEDKLKDTFCRQYHDAFVIKADQQIASLREECDAFQRLVGKLKIEKSGIRADLENVCKELSVLKIEIEKCEEAHYAKNAVIDKLLAQHRMPKD